VGGSAIRVVSREILDAQTPGWHIGIPQPATKHYVYSPLDPRRSTSIHRRMVLAAWTLSTPLPSRHRGSIMILVDDVYATALINYMLYRAYSKDAEYAANAAQATAFYQQFMALLGAKVTAETVTAPNQALAGFNPNVPATQK
jgi:hypothetical protein